MNTIPEKFYALNVDSIPHIFNGWKSWEHSLKYIRLVLTSFKIQRDYQIKKNRHPKVFKRLSEYHYNYLSEARSKSEIALILWIAHRYSQDKGSCRFKIKDLAKVSGIARQTLSTALSELIKKGVIFKQDLHPNCTIAHGNKYCFLSPKPDIETWQNLTPEAPKPDA